MRKLAVLIVFMFALSILSTSMVAAQTETCAGKSGACQTGPIQGSH